MKIHKIYFLALFILVLPLIYSATSLTPVKTSECANLLQSISNATFCNVTVYYPNQSIGLDNQLMTKIGDIYNYSFCDTQNSGIYTYLTQCNPNGMLGDPIPVDFLVNGYGSEVSTGQTIGYAIVFIISLLIFGITLYGAFKMPFNNNRDEEGKVISINDLKYLKVVLWVIAYLELLFIISISKNMALGFLLNDGIFNFLNITYTILLIGLIPFFPLLIFFTIVIWLNDKKTLNGIQRGIYE